MKKDLEHIKIREKIEELINKNYPIQNIAKILKLPIGSRYIKKSIKWYIYCIKAKENQRKAIEKHPNLYSKAGKIAQQKHPWIGKELGKKYGAIQGKINTQRLKGNSKYFSEIAKKLHKINPNHSKENMKKAHKTMKIKGTFYKHQKNAALKCMGKNPNQLKEMSKKAHSLYPLALLALESRRKNYPYKYDGCLFDSDGERKLCKILVSNKLMYKPKERENVHFRIKRCHIDFFIKKKVFIEYHPAYMFKELLKDYYNRRRKLLDENGYRDYPLIVIDRLSNIEPKINKIKDLVSLELDK